MSYNKSNQQRKPFRLTKSSMGLNCNCKKEKEQETTEEAADTRFLSAASSSMQLQTKSITGTCCCCANRTKNALSILDKCPRQKEVFLYRFANNIYELGKTTISFLTAATQKSLKPENDVKFLSEFPNMLPTSHYRRQLNKQRQEHFQFGNLEALMNVDINDVYLKRLEAIDSKDSQNLSLCLINYQEWKDSLTHTNTFLIDHSQKLETEIFESLNKHFVETTTETKQLQHTNLKLQHDIGELVKIIENAYRKNIWKFDDINLKTITLPQVLGTATADGSVKKKNKSQTQITQKKPKSEMN